MKPRIGVAIGATWNSPRCSRLVAMRGLCNVLAASIRFGSLARATIAANDSRPAGNTHPMKVRNKGQAELAAGGSGLSEEEFPVLVPKALIERTRTGALIDLLRIKLGFPPEVFARAAYPVIEGYAGFVQLLPAPDSPHHARPGGRFAYGLEVALRALDYRRGQILPRGAVPEVIGAHSHRWTYAVFVAALAYGVGNIEARLRILVRVGGREPRPWDPHAESMLAAGVSSYRVEIVLHDAAKADARRALGARLFDECVPGPVRAWLTEDAALMPELLAWLTNDENGPQGAIAELVLRAATGSFPRRTAVQSETDSQLSVAAAMANTEEHERPIPEHEEPEYLEDAIEELPQAPEPAGTAKVENSRTPLTQTCAHPSSARAETSANSRESEVARSFITWLRQGIAEGAIRVNEPGALVHGVNEGMLLVSPRIFREFSKQFRNANAAESVTPSSDAEETVKWVQREVLRAGWHVRADRGVNIIAYQVMRRDRLVSRLSGVVLRDPTKFIDPAPALNPVLARAEDAQHRP